MFVFDLFKLFAITVPPIGVTVTAVGAVGAVLSKMIGLPAVTAVICIASLFTISLKLSVNGIVPSVSDSCII